MTVEFEAAEELNDLLNEEEEGDDQSDVEESVSEEESGSSGVVYKRLPNGKLVVE